MTAVDQKILIIEDDNLLNKVLVKQVGKMGYSTDGVFTFADAEKYLEKNEPDLILLDGNLPDADGMNKLSVLSPLYPVIMLTAFGSIEKAVEAIKAGASEYLAKPVNLDELEITIRRVLERSQLKRQNEFYKTVAMHAGSSAIIGNSAALKIAIDMIDAVGPTEATVLVNGESGVGKELVAREIHNNSARASNPYVAIDCCTLQENLFESELFGHERGAFTGADKQKKGLIQVAEGGTIFLDEIGEITPSIQAKLLRILETGTYRRVGGTKDLKANVRIVAATNRDLFKMSEEGSYRADLYYRLSAFTIVVPPLRDRIEDVVLLANHFINNHDFSRKILKSLSKSAQELLCSYDWPGNVRELRNAMERAIILSREDSEIRPEHFALVSQQSENPGQPSESVFDTMPTMEGLKEQYVKFVLEKSEGNRRVASRTLGISERNLYRMVDKYGL